MLDSEQMTRYASEKSEAKKKKNTKRMTMRQISGKGNPVMPLRHIGIWC